MTTLAAIEAAAKARNLEVLGGFYPESDDGTPDHAQTVFLLGPAEPGFWSGLKTSREFVDGVADPVDRWSERVVGELATEVGATAVFPFGGPPYQPFIRWAKRTGRIWSSPVGLLVHDTQGLMVSFRGALVLGQKLDLPPRPKKPCDTCDGQPCRTACPVGALTRDGYDTDACHGFLDTQQGSDCMSHGCKARRACPVSQRYGRVSAQSAYHMQQFHP